MAEQPLFAYAVTLVFGTGPIVQDARIAPDPAAAAACAMFNVMRQAPPAEDLTGVSVMPLPLEWLRFAVRSIEAGETGRVLSLVQAGSEIGRKLTTAENAEVAASVERERRTCWRHSATFPVGEHCPQCAAEDDAKPPGSAA